MGGYNFVKKLFFIKSLIISIIHMSIKPPLIKEGWNYLHHSLTVIIYDFSFLSIISTRQSYFSSLAPETRMYGSSKLKIMLAVAEKTLSKGIFSPFKRRSKSFNKSSKDSFITGISKALGLILLPKTGTCFLYAILHIRMYC